MSSLVSSCSLRNCNGAPPPPDGLPTALWVPARLTRPDGAVVTVAYNGVGLPTELTEADGSRWHHTYDERGLRTATTDPTGAVTCYGYDARGHLASVTNAPGDTTSVVSNRAGLPEEIRDPLGAATMYAHVRPSAAASPSRASPHTGMRSGDHFRCRAAPALAVPTLTFMAISPPEAHHDVDA
jgi:YD repeat-containing protein